MTNDNTDRTIDVSDVRTFKASNTITGKHVWVYNHTDYLAAEAAAKHFTCFVSEIKLKEDKNMTALPPKPINATIAALRDSADHFYAMAAEHATDSHMHNEFLRAAERCVKAADVVRSIRV